VSDSCTSPTDRECRYPGHALNHYLARIERHLDSYKRRQISFAKLLELRAEAAAQFNGLLADQFLVRAHNVRGVLAMVDDAPPAVGHGE